jgi:hypothetical protein
MAPAHDNAYRPLVEPLADDPSFIERPMFGALACYHRGRLKFVLCDDETPWNGVLVATERAHHASLISEFPLLKEHPVLGKWLYLAAETDGFDGTARRVVIAALRDDERVGVVPPPKTKRKKKRKEGTQKKVRRRG